jgi:hypothetical protein
MIYWMTGGWFLSMVMICAWIDLYFAYKRMLARNQRHCQHYETLIKRLESESITYPEIKIISPRKRAEYRMLLSKQDCIAQQVVKYKDQRPLWLQDLLQYEKEKEC